MSKITPMSLEEHRKLGALLSMIEREVMASDHLNLYKKNSVTLQRFFKLQEALLRFRSRMEDISLKDYGDDAWPSAYFIPAPKRQGVPLDKLVDESMREALDIIRGHVPAPVTDLALKCDRRLYSLRIAIKERPEDRLRGKPRGYLRYLDGAQS